MRGAQQSFGFLPWLEVRDGDPTALLLMSRHYTARAARAASPESVPLILGPGEKYLLLSPCGRALAAWRKFIDHADDGTGSPQSGVNCAVFRNEGAGLSSALIWSAALMARARWPDERRLYTYVDPARVASSNPGWCFIRAGWRACGWTRGGLRILELVAPEPSAFGVRASALRVRESEPGMPEFPRRGKTAADAPDPV